MSVWRLAVMTTTSILLCVVHAFCKSRETQSKRVVTRCMTSARPCTCITFQHYSTHTYANITMHSGTHSASIPRHAFALTQPRQTPTLNRTWTKQPHAANKQRLSEASSGSGKASKTYRHRHSLVIAITGITTTILLQAEHHNNTNGESVTKV